MVADPWCIIEPMKLERTVIDGTPVIGITENLEIDVGNCGEFQRQFFDLVEDSDRRVIFDASRVEFFDSAGMGALLPIAKRLRGRGGEFAVAGLNRPVMEVFRMVGFDLILATFDELEAALETPEGSE